MYLVDTNIFLEIFLDQERKEECKDFLLKNPGKLSISDFSLHSIGVILFRNGMNSVFNDFLNDIRGKLSVRTLSPDGYKILSDISDRSALDFDDSYQYSIAKENDMAIVTMDRDFSRVTDVDVVFI